MGSCRGRGTDSQGGDRVASLKTQRVAEGLIRGRGAEDSKAQECLPFSPQNSDDLQW